MKKQMSILMVAVLGIFFMFGTAMAVDVADYTADTIDKMGGHDKTSVRPQDGKVFVELYDVSLTPIGVDTQGENLKRTDALLLYSGIVDGAGDKRPCDIGTVGADNKVTFEKGFPNSGLIKKVPVVEHLWARNADNSMAGTFDPMDTWIIGDGEYGTQRYLDTLVIGIVMYPDGTIVPLKSLGLGKLKQGLHPELMSTMKQ